MSNNRIVGGWRLVNFLGKGGNAQVWEAEKDGQNVALKILSELSLASDAMKRFSHEIDTLKLVADLPGILPVLEANLPLKPSKSDPAWFAMPIATGIQEALGERPPIRNVVEAVSQIARTLAELAKRKISHRDIKPQNLYFYGGRYAVGDFGLVDFPDKEAVTESGRALGPRFFIAPEMVTAPVTASGFPADVWSLAKTLWALAAGEKFPPPYPHQANIAQIALSNRVHDQNAYLLDNLVERATLINPAERPTMEEVANELEKWLTLKDQPQKPIEIGDLVQNLSILMKPWNETIKIKERAEKRTIELQDIMVVKFATFEHVYRNMGLLFQKINKETPNILEFDKMADEEYHNSVTLGVYAQTSQGILLKTCFCASYFPNGKHRIGAGHIVNSAEYPPKIQPAFFGRISAIVQGESAEEASYLDDLLMQLNNTFRIAVENYLTIIKSL